MDFFNYKNGELHCENVPASRIADEVGTPVYVYSKATLLHHYRQVARAFAPVNPTICYSIKSCGNLHVCKVLVDEGCGMDVTSGGELFRALKAGCDPKKIIYAGVGKTDDEIRMAIDAGIAAFNIKTHAKTTTGKKETKFGVDIERAERVFEQYKNLKNLRIAGVHLHIGSPIYDIEPYVHAVKKANDLIDRLTEKGHKIEWLDMGGGFAVNYKRPDQALPVTEHAKALLPLLQGRPYKIALEPGRYISGNAGIVLTRVLYRKQGGEKRFVIVDAAMNDLIRPTLYEAYHFIWPVKPDPKNVPAARDEGLVPADGETVDVVGPVCESGDYLAMGRQLPKSNRGDLLAIFTAGAYGFVMSSNYNSRPRAAEVLVDGDNYTVIRRRETYDDLIAAEMV
jgi:diaminopimelate decarboxylase